MRTDCEWIKFVPAGASPSGKTQIWHVMLKDQSLVGGEIRWWGAWRKYAFFPGQGTLYEQDCLRDIARFIEELTHSHRTSSKMELEKK